MLASAVEADLLGMEMYRHDSQFYGGDGNEIKGMENTIDAVSQQAAKGWHEGNRQGSAERHARKRHCKLSTILRANIKQARTEG